MWSIYEQFDFLISVRFLVDIISLHFLKRFTFSTWIFNLFQFMFTLVVLIYGSGLHKSEIDQLCKSLELIRIVLSAILRLQILLVNEMCQRKFHPCLFKLSFLIFHQQFASGCFSWFLDFYCSPIANCRQMLPNLSDLFKMRLKLMKKSASSILKGAFPLNNSPYILAPWTHQVGIFSLIS